MADFDATLRAAGGQVHQLPAHRRWDLMRRWREVYARNLHLATGKWTHRGYDWHTFSYGYAPAQADFAALRAYEGLAVPARAIVCPHDDRLPAVEIIGGARLPDFREHGLDIMVWPDDLAWTMAFTHEDGWLGPYFCRRELLEAARPGQTLR